MPYHTMKDRYNGFDQGFFLERKAGSSLLEGLMRVYKHSYSKWEWSRLLLLFLSDPTWMSTTCALRGY